EINDLKKHFKVSGGQRLKAVDGITVDIFKGETFGLVGESGCGKSTAGRTIMPLYESTDGDVVSKNNRVHDKNNKKELKHLKQEMHMSFQAPYASLTPRMTVTDVIAGGLDVHGLLKSKKGRQGRVDGVLDTV